VPLAPAPSRASCRLWWCSWCRRTPQVGPRPTKGTY
jgi:hypothetical protein